MKILMVSSGSKALTDMIVAVEAVFPGAEQARFLDPLLAIKHNLSWHADTVICDFSLRIIDGIQLIQMLRKQNRDILPILIASAKEPCRDADNLGILHVAQADAQTLKAIMEQG
ncbi:MAG: hypothetical protein PHY12_02165 [Eubacteriales bacterium]|nr:hypothetical protein [Eubacteriales bacterium]